MAMTRDFTWNIQGRPQALEQMAANAAAAEASLGANQYADRMAARSMGLQALPDTTFGQAQAGINARMGDEAVRAAELQELAQLKAEREQRMNDPGMKMAAMLAMAGQPGAIQSMLMQQAPDGSASRSQAQSDMDELEAQIVKDMFALADADQDTYEKLTAGLLPLYRSKWEEFAKKGGKSRMGGSDWDSGWGQIIAGLGATRDKRKAAADRKKNEKSDLRNL